MTGRRSTSRPRAPTPLPRSPLGRLAGLLVAVAVVALLGPAGPAGPARTIAAGGVELGAPTRLRAIHRSGQTFLTWRERSDVAGERYLVYRYQEPIGPDPAGATHLVGTVGERSSRMWTERVGEGGWRFRFLSRAVIADGGPLLGTDQGLFVWTPGRAGLGGADEGDAYYAVVTAKGAQRSVAATTGAVHERVGTPRAVHARSLAGGRIRVMVQYMDLRTWNGTYEAPRAANDWLGYGRGAPGVRDALALAYAYAIALPVAAHCPGGRVPKRLPVLVVLHGKQDGNLPPDLSPPAWCAIELRPYDRDDSRWFGFGMRTDYRTGAVPGPGDEIANFTESRLLRMLDELVDDPDLAGRVDPQRIYVTGRSMGGGATLGLTLRYPEVFAAGLARAALVDYRDTRPRATATLSRIWGSPSDDLPVRLLGPARLVGPIAPPDGTGIWTWEDHAAQARAHPERETAPVGVLQGLQDGVANPKDQLVPLVRSLELADRPYAVVLRDGPHKIPGWDGLPATMGLVRGVPFSGLRVVRDETVPAFGGDPAVRPALDPDRGASVYTAIEWSASWRPWDGAPVDRADRWAMSLRTIDGRRHTVTVTPRRVERFRVAPGTQVRYEIHAVGTGTITDQGTVTADEDGLVTVRCTIDPHGIRLVLVAGG